MSANLARLRKRAAELELKKQFDRALEVYVQILDEGGKDLDDEDVPLFNRVGDMLMRKGSVTEALGYYERAVDMYAERGYLNNAIALCSKILRQSPGRAAVYYKLARISAKKGFKSDARKNFLEYADRMQKLGMADEAFRALKEFASLYPDQDDVRLVLAELLSKENRKGEAIEQLQSLYEKLQAEGRSAEARATVDRMRAIDPNATPREGNQTTSPAPAGDLIFLDLSDGSAENGASPASARAPVRTPVPALTGLSITFLPPNADAPHPEGFESTAVEPEPVDTPPIARSLTPLGGELVVDQLPASDPPARDVQGYVPFDVIEGAPEQAGAAAEDGESEPEEVTPRSATPRYVTPRSATPRSATPRSATPRSATPRHMTPRSMTPREVTPRHNTPMSGIEFAHLELDDAPREHAPRQHDLSLPGNLPVTPDDTAAVSGPVPTSDAAAEDARRAAMDAADLAADMAAREAGLLHPAPGPVSPPVVEEPYDEPPAVMEFEPLVPEETPEPEPEPEPIEIPDDFMALPPSFGSTDHHSDEHAAFPPIFGLVESAGEEELAEQELAEQELAEEPGTPAEEDARAPSATVQQPTLSLGSAEAHLRRRLELEPENWELRRQLGEALLDTGDRDGGLYELELAMAGFELRGDLDRAQEVVDEILGVFPASVAHHQKRVEYAVRSRDRVRLTNSYLELADALFRTGAGDKAVAVYARVLELDTNNERAEFALSTLAPDELVRLRGAPERPDRWTAELDAIEVNAGAEPAPDANAGITVEPPVEGPVDVPPDESEPAAPAVVAAAPAPAPQNPETVEIIGLELPDPDWGEGLPTPAPVAAISPQPVEPGHPVTEIEWKDDEQVVPHEAAPTEVASPPEVKEEPEDLVFELAEDLPREVTPTVAPERIPTPSAAEAPFNRMDTPASIEAAAPRKPTPRATPPVAKPPIRRLTPVGASDADFVDLGEWLRHTEPTRSTRMHVEDPKPTGDEQADFDEMLRRFKRGVAENVEAEDFEAHYDLGVAYKEMGLVDEAIAQFQKSLRGDSHRVRSYEALGQCFVEQKQYPIASALLQRATEVPGSDDRQLVGVLYLLGFALEHLGRPAEALQYYLRVFAVDIEFRDIAARIAAMGNLTK